MFIVIYRSIFNAISIKIPMNFLAPDKISTPYSRIKMFLNKLGNI